MDGRNSGFPAFSLPVDMANMLTRFGDIHPKWLGMGISEASTVVVLQTKGKS